MIYRRLIALVTGLMLLLPTAALAQPTDDTSDDASGETESDALAELEAFLEGYENGDLPDAGDPELSFSNLLSSVLDALQFAILVESVEDDAGDDADGELLAAVVQDETNTDTEDDDGLTDTVHGEIVSTVAQCAPTGNTVRDVFNGVRNHGALVSAAARGGEVTVSVPVIEDGALLTDTTDSGTTLVMTDTVFDLSTVDGAEDLCLALELVERANALADELAAQESDEVDEQRGNRPDHAGPKDDEGDDVGATDDNDNGRPDHAGPPEDRGNNGNHGPSADDADERGRPAHAGPKDKSDVNDADLDDQDDDEDEDEGLDVDDDEEDGEDS